MRSLGFDDFPLGPDPESSFGFDLLDGQRMASAFYSTMVSVSPYGMLDLDHVRRWGYGLDPDQAKKLEARARSAGRDLTDREREALYGSETEKGGRSVVNGREVPEGGCAEEATRRTTRGVADADRLWSYVPERTVEIDKVVAKDERVRRAFRDWSRCVEDKGFKRYENPTEAFLDKAWWKGREDGGSARSERELGTAVADVECNLKLNTAGVWWSVSKEKQREELRRNKSRYEAVRRDADRVRAEIREALGEK
ncbi:hypothetical protein [Streptomyces sp. NPDC029674]|uniref:hypothetical protein n=1 Tax=Streptomyces sp. NPDC029674 TaxID=3365297 RepID=UPI00384F4B83